jgi:AraC family transcriptional regulator
MAYSGDLSVWPPTAQSARAAVGVDRCAADPAAPPKDWVYAAPAIGFVLSGWFDYCVEGRSVFAAPGAVVLGNAGEHFQVRHHDPAGNRRAFAILPHGLLEDVANAEQLDAARFPSIAIPPSPSTTRMLGWLRAIERHASEAEEAAYALVRAALRAPERQKKHVSTNSRARVQAAARYIDEHFAEPCALSTVSQAVGLSRYELIRAFSAVMGQSPNQYLINTRIRAAAERLEASNAPIADIAFGVGFNDISYFYHCFRTAFGCTPLQWRARC